MEKQKCKNCIECDWLLAGVTIDDEIVLKCSKFGKILRRYFNEEDE